MYLLPIYFLFLQIIFSQDCQCSFYDKLIIGNTYRQKTIFGFIIYLAGQFTHPPLTCVDTLYICCYTSILDFCHNKLCKSALLMMFCVNIAIYIGTQIVVVRRFSSPKIVKYVCIDNFVLYYTYYFDTIESFPKKLVKSHTDRALIVYFMFNLHK